MERGTKKGKAACKRLFALVLTLAMVLTSVSVPSVTAEAAKNVKVKKIQITNPKKKKVTLVKGKTLQIKVKVTPKNAKNKKVTYKSSKKKIASVTKKGKVKGLKKGTAKITVTAKDGSKKKATLTVKVVNPVKVTKVTVSPAATTVDIGKTVTLKAACAPKNATNKAVSWKTSDKGVATVTSAGVVKGVKAGTAKITATAKDGSKKSATCTVTVKAASVNPNPNPPTPAVKTLEGIAITKAPAKTEYYRDETFDPTGMEVTASYTDTSTKVLAANEYTLNPSVDTPLKTTNKTVTVSYTEGGVTKTATTPIKVTAAPTVQSISIENGPAKTEYMEGDIFDPTGMKVVATLSNGEKKELAADIDYTYSKEPLAVTAGAEKTMFEISYKVSASKTLTAEVEILVKAQYPLTSITAQLKQTELAREGACFNDDDVTVTAHFDGADDAVISVADCTVNPAVFTKETTSATITYWYGGVSKTVTVDGFTVTTYREGYTFEDATKIGTVVKRANDGNQVVPDEAGAAGVEIADADFVEGITGKALKMNGTYGLRLDNIAGSNASKDYSISAWIKPETTFSPNQALIISTANKFGQADGLPETWCSIAANDPDGTSKPSDNKLKLWSHAVGGDEEDWKWQVVGKTATAIPVGTDAGWTHIALVVDGSGEADDNYATGTLYVNGRMVASGKVRNEKNADMKTYLGVTAWSADGYYKGLIDELVFTGEVLTEADIQKSYMDGVVNSGNQLVNITSVSPDDGAEVEVEYGTSLADVKRELMKIAYTAKAEGSEEDLPLATTSDMWTLDNYTTTSEGNVQATLKLQAPEGYLFKQNGELSVTLERKVTVKIKNPVTISAVTPSQTTIEVPYGTSEDAIKNALAGLTFTVTTSDSSTYEIANAKSLWTVEADGDNYKAVFDLKRPEPGYKYADGVKVEVQVTVKQPISITALAVAPNTLTVDYNTSEADVKDELAKLAISATVAAGSEAPEGISNTADIWAVADYNPEGAGNYTATATVAAPVGYKFADGVGEVTVTVTVKPQGEHKLSSIKVTTNPRVKYIVGDDFDKTGMVVTASYEDGAHEDVTAKATIGTATNLQVGTQNIEISYSEGEGAAAITKTCTLTITTVNVEDGAAAHYGFDESLEDSKGGASAVVATNKTMADNTNTPTYADGLVGKGISLGEVKEGGAIDQNVIRLGSTVNSSNFTINIWANPRTLARSHALLLNGLPENAPTDRQLAIYTCSRNTAKELKIFNGSVEFTASDVWDVGTWSMVTWVNSDDKIFVYMNGEKIFEVENKVNVAKLKKLFISGSPYDEVFDGYVDEVSIYDSSLSQDQVTALYNTVKPTISGISVDTTEINLTKAEAGSDATAIQNKLKALKINVVMKNGTAPVFENNTDWTLTPAYSGNAGTFTATKEVTIPDGYDKTKDVNTTLSVTVKVVDITLQSIAVTTVPNKGYYKVGEEFDKAGMVVTATYSDGSTKDVTESVTITNGTATAPTSGDTAAQEVTVSYTEGDDTKTAAQTITVIADNPSTLEGQLLAARTAYYSFDDTLVNPMSADKIGKTVKLTAYNAYADTNLSDIYSEDSVHGKSLSVAKDVAVEIPESIAAENKAFTINLWAKKKEGTTTYAAIFHGKNDKAGFGKGIVFYANPGGATDKLELQTNGGDGNANQVKQFAMGNDTWKMLTLVNEENGIRFYIDGEEQTLTNEEKAALSVTGGIQRMFLGLGQWAVADHMIGNIDEVSIYNISLTEDHVKTLYNGSKPATE